MTDYALEGVAWNTPGQIVTWSLATSNFPDRNLQFSAFLTPAYLGDIKAAFDTWAAVANVKFVQVADNGTADIRFGLNAIDGPLGIAGMTNYLAGGTPGGPSNLVSTDITFDSSEGWHPVGGHQVSADGQTPFYAIALHEIGHALGLGHYNASPAIMNSVVTIAGLTGSDVDGIRALYGANAGGAPAIARSRTDVTSAGETLASTFFDVFLNNGHANTTFVFNPGFGNDLIGGFVTGGPGHDVIDLPASHFADILDVLHHTQPTPGGAVIHDPYSGDTIRLAGVAKTDLIAHRNLDVTFHG